MTQFSTILMIILLAIQVVAQVMIPGTSPDHPTANTYTYESATYTRQPGTNQYRSGTGGNYEYYDPKTNTIYTVSGVTATSSGTLDSVTNLNAGTMNYMIEPGDDVAYTAYVEETRRPPGSQAPPGGTTTAPTGPAPERAYTVNWNNPDGTPHLPTDVGGQSMGTGTDRNIYYTNAGSDPVARITPQGYYEVQNADGTWSTATYEDYKDAIDDSIRADLIADGMPAGAADDAAVAQAAKAAENGNAVANSQGYQGFCSNGWRCIGSLLGAYQRSAGYGDATAYIIGGDYYEYTQQMRNRLTQSFCLAAGVENCLVSLICGQMLDLDDGNILAGRGPGGEFVRSGSINAEKSLPIQIAGLSGEMLRDIFGTELINIQGQIINVSHPDFDPKKYGTLTLKRYHFQLHLQNNAASTWSNFNAEPLEYNIHFRGEREVTWFPDRQTLEPGESTLLDEYVVSTYNYDDICARFDPGLPSQSAGSLAVGGGGSFVTHHLCSPFDQYGGGATIGPTTAAAAAAAPGSGPAPGTGI